MATVTVAGQDSPTTTLELEISPGDAPLYVVAGGYDPIIWRVTCATERVRHLALVGGTVGGGKAAGATGLPADRVSFHDARDCFGYEYDPQSASFRANADVVADQVGVVPSFLAGAYSTSGFLLPESSLLPEAEPHIPAGWNQDVVREALRFSPDGLIEIDAESVVAQSKAKDYVVLPQQFGLAQLVASGMMVAESYDEFYIIGPIGRYPAGLGGAHAVKFHIDPGVPDPAGSPGHSEVTRLVHSYEGVVRTPE